MKTTSFTSALVIVAAGLFVACGGNNGNNGDDPVVIDSGTDPDAAADMGGGVEDLGGEADVSTPDMAEPVDCPEPTGMRPPRLSEHAGAFVPNDTGGVIVVFGGSLGIPENCGFPERTYETTTWLYDVGCDSWTKLDASGPAGRTRHTAVYDSANHRVLVYGGLSASGSLSDTWALDMGSLEWSQISTTGAPPARINHAAVYDENGGRMLVFGGNLGPSVINIDPANDVWALDLTTNGWSDVTPAAAGPDERLWVSALYDPANDQMVIFGGGDDSAFTGTVSYRNDAWAWSDASGEPTWTEVGGGQRNVPDGRFWAGWTYDDVNKRYVLFGGHDATSLGNRNDTWFLDPATDEWTQELQGDIYNAPPNGQCDFPADFTIVQEASPERRNAHVFVSGGGSAYSMGGKTDCGVIDDLVRLDLATGEWESLTRATAGEVCLRRGGGDTCSSLCL